MLLLLNFVFVFDLQPYAIFPNMKCSRMALNSMELRSILICMDGVCHRNYEDLSCLVSRVVREDVKLPIF